MKWKIKLFCSFWWFPSLWAVNSHLTIWPDVYHIGGKSWLILMRTVESSKLANIIITLIIDILYHQGSIWLVVCSTVLTVVRISFILFCFSSIIHPYGPASVPYQYYRRLIRKILVILQWTDVRLKSGDQLYKTQARSAGGDSKLYLYYKCFINYMLIYFIRNINPEKCSSH